ncbi:MAG: hypothetical protein FWF24_00755 [Alphaproteobacteria bacterium]|nr:hypothetical protein [Alphaproteobacteria bacterium]
MLYKGPDNQVKHKTSALLMLVWGVLFSFLLTGIPIELWAQVPTPPDPTPILGGGDTGDDTLGQLVCNINNNADGYTFILSVIAWIVGGFLIVRGVLLLRKSADDPNNSQVTKAVAHFIAGAALIGLPTFVGVVRRTLFGVFAGGGLNACVPGATVSVSGGQGLDIMMQSFVRNMYGPMFTLVSVLGILIGLTFIVKALLAGAATGTDPRTSNPKTIITNLVIGAVLVSLSTVLPDVLGSIFASGEVSNVSQYSAIAWSKVVGDADTTAINNTVRAVLAFIQIIGVIAFLRGWLLIKTAMDGGQATVPQGVVHVVAGAMALNIDKMIEVFNNTFGLDLLT